MSSGEIDENSFINDNSLLYEIRHYLTQSEKDAFMEWRRQFRNTRAKIAVDRRINRNILFFKVEAGRVL